MISEPSGTKGIRFFYEDTGAPKSSVYTTLVILHGLSYHSAIFHRLLPLADKHNLRIVLLNRRDYPGTTYTTPEEIEKLRGPRVEDQAEALKALGLEIADFLLWYIRTSSISPIAKSGDVGGMAILAWSGGNVTGLSFIANLDMLSEDERDVFRDYLRTFIIYEASFYALGLQAPPEIYHLFRDPTFQALDFEEQTSRFNVFVSSYYQHPGIESRALSGLSQQPIVNPPPDKIPTFNRLSSAEVERVTFPEALTRGEGLIRYIHRDVHKEHVRKIFYDEESVKMFPKLKMKLLWCRESMVEPPMGAWTMQKNIDEFAEQGGKGRRLEVYDMEGNHFAHWDQPEETMEFVTSML